MKLRIYNFCKDNAWAVCLGVIVASAGWTFLTWQFYAAVIPMGILHAWSVSK